VAGDGKYDVIVVGSGPGGYVACLRAAELGLRAACVEKSDRVGGACLNVGCIPSKALLESSRFFYLARKRFQEHGIVLDDQVLDLPVMMARKSEVVRGLVDNVRKLLENAGVALIRGTARLAGERRVEVTRDGEKTVLEADAVVLATGGEPVPVPSLPFDGRRIVSSTEVLDFDRVPEHLAVVGGGTIGLELGSVWSRLGARVTVIEMMPGIAAVADGQVSRTLERLLSRQGLEFRLRTKVTGAEVTDEQVVLTLDTQGKEDSIACDRVLVAVGRKPFTGGLGLEALGIGTDPRTGHVLVDERYRTGVAWIYAVGDLVPGPMLAHKASAEGIAAVECIAGLPGEVNYDTIPSVIYTSPEVAGVGLTEEQARERGLSFVAGSCPFTGSARARCMGDTDGFVKVIAHGRTGRLLGVHIIGPEASELIGECAGALERNATAEEFARVVRAHPTLSEAVRDAALIVQSSRKHE